MRVRVVGENQDESKWSLYRRRMRQRRYDSCQQQSTEIYKCYLLLQRDTTFLITRHTVRDVPGASSYGLLTGRRQQSNNKHRQQTKGIWATCEAKGVRR